MKIKLLISAVFFGASLFAQVSITIGPPPRPLVRIQPASPGTGYMWVDGYQYPEGNRYRWHDGYWTRPPYEGARWQAPRYDNGRYYMGQWSGDRGDIGHDHRWDRKHDRDFDHDRNEDKHEDKHKDKHGDKHDNRR